MPRNKTDNLASHAANIVNDEVFQQIIFEMKQDSLRNLETNKLRAYGQDNLERDRAVVQYQIVCQLEEKFLGYARRK